MLKETNNLVPAPGSSYSYKDDWSEQTQLYGSGPAVNGTYKSILGTDDGKFVPGQFRVNPVTIRTLTSQITAGSYFHGTNPLYYHNYEGPLIGCMSFYGAALCNVAANYFTAPWDQRHAEQALIRAYSKANDASLQVGVILGELGETIKFLKNPLRELLKFVNRPTFLSGANTWLSYRYGLRPLMKDVSDAIALIKKGFRSKSGIQRVRSTNEFTDNRSVCYDDHAACFRGATLNVKEEIKYKTTAVVYYTFTNSSLDKLEQLGLSPFDAAGVLWELVPLSFVVDWFLSINSWLTAIKPTFSVTYYGNCVSQKTVFTRELSWQNELPHIGYTFKSFQSPKVKIEESKLVRMTNQALPALPPVNLDYKSFTHVIDSLALTSQRVSRRLGKLR